MVLCNKTTPKKVSVRKISLQILPCYVIRSLLSIYSNTKSPGKEGFPVFFSPKNELDLPLLQFLELSNEQRPASNAKKPKAVLVI